MAEVGVIWVEANGLFSCTFSQGWEEVVVLLVEG